VKKLITWIVIVAATCAAGYAAVTLLAGPLSDYVGRLVDPDRDAGETVLDRTEKSPHDEGFNVVIARVLSKSKGTPIKWNYYDQVGDASYNLKEPPLVIEHEKEPRLRWIKSLHTELCTSPRAYVWQHLWMQPGGGSSHHGTVNGDDLVFEFKNPDGSLRWTVSVTKAC
jgi:hypothetical protein